MRYTVTDGDHEGLDLCPVDGTMTWPEDGSQVVDAADYDAVVAERDALKFQIENLRSRIETLRQALGREAADAYRKLYGE